MASTPARRSRRDQPVVQTPSKSKEPHPKETWLGPPIHSRPAQPSDDLPFDDEPLDEDEEWTTNFYNGFRRTRAGEKREEYCVGDTILVKGLFKDTHVGVIIGLWSVSQIEEERQFVMLQWFLKPKQLPKTGADRDHRHSEIYFTPSQTVVYSTSCIITHCIVSPPSSSSFSSPTKKTPRWTYVSTEEFYCDSTFDSTSGQFTAIVWTKHREIATRASLNNPEMAKDLWAVKTPDAKGKAKAVEVDPDESGSDGGDQFKHDSESSQDDDVSSAEDEAEDSPVANEDEDEMNVEAPAGRKRGRPPATRKVPRSQKCAKTKIRPTNKSSHRKRRVRVSKPSILDLDDDLCSLPADPHVRAMYSLHVASTPGAGGSGGALPGREGEFDEVLGSVLGVLEEGSGGCIYISGVPGTGKTATVHAVVRELRRMAEQGETSPFTYVEINGLRLPEPSAAYALLWEAVAGHDVQAEGHLKISSKEALKRLDRYFHGGGGRSGPSGGAYVVLMDELDQLVTAKQDVVYNFFDWPNLPSSKVLVIAVSNTHDLPERVMSAKVKSRLGMERIQFHPYTRDQLVGIVQNRLNAAKESLRDDHEELASAVVMHEDAIKYASARVAAVNGDARRVLDIARRAVETVYHPDSGKSGIVKMPEVTAVIKAMQNSPSAAYVRECSFSERLVLAALVKVGKREGVGELKWGDITQQSMILFEQLREDTDHSLSRPTVDRLRFVLSSLACSKAVIVEGGTGPAERKPFLDRLVMLNLEVGEVVRALSDSGGSRWENVLGT